MSNQKISTILALSLLTSPIALPAKEPTLFQKTPIEILPAEKTSQRTASRRMKHLLAGAPSIKPIGTYVGELQEKWQFPSDHLPIGMTLDDLNIASWNVLDANYMNWVIEKNSQGLSRSQIVDEHVFINDSNLTVRDQHVVRLLLEMINNPSYPRSLIALQECSEAFLEELRSQLPAGFEIVSQDDNAFVVDTNVFDIVSVKGPTGVFSNQPNRSIQDVLLCRKDTGEEIRILNGHLPGDPTKPARFEFAEYLSQTHDPKVITLAMGDMNFNEIEMKEAFTQAFQNESPFEQYTPYCTNISPYTFISKAIDHFFVFLPEKKEVTLNDANDVLDGLNNTLELLQGSLASHS